jgi:hypothetical protein
MDMGGSSKLDTTASQHLEGVARLDDAGPQAVIKLQLSFGNRIGKM